MAKKHAQYIDTAKKLAASQWGKNYDDDEEAQLEMLKGITLEGACMLGIVRRIDRFFATLAIDEVTLQLERVKDKVEGTIDAWVKEREAVHGKCPEVVIHYLRQEAKRAIGERVLSLGDLRVWYYPTLPPRKTEERRQYDKWMRSKLKGNKS